MHAKVGDKSTRIIGDRQEKETEMLLHRTYCCGWNADFVLEKELMMIKGI